MSLEVCPSDPRDPRKIKTIGAHDLLKKQKQFYEIGQSQAVCY